MLHQNIHDNKDGTLKKENIQELSKDLLPLKTLAYKDKTNKYSGNIKYLVRAIEIETTPSGTYKNLGSGTSTSIDFEYKDPVSIAESVLENTLKIYPNPSNNVFTLSFNIDQANTIFLRIFDSSGKLHHAEKLDSKVGLNELRLKLNLNNGIYWLSLSNGSEQTTKKLVITSF